MDKSGHIAAIRFGHGLRLDQAPPADPEAWLLGQLDQPDAAPPGPGLGEAMQVRLADLQARRSTNPVGDPEETRRAFNALNRAEVEAHAAWRLDSTQPFRDRLVDFWVNHFTVSRRVGNISVLMGSYERDAIRPHVTGRFADMLLAVARQPAMLVYLDNTASMGPSSPAGLRIRRGLNENLAREMLELHTLSPAGGYTQGDVQELAKILTGWNIEGGREPFGFRFRPAMHEPGEKFLLGRRIPAGEAAGEAALRLLAEHPATWRHLAVKLARHFVADDPPPDAVRALHMVLRDTGGDLGATARALVALPQAWAPPLAKFRTPADYVLATCRALGATPAQAGLVVQGMAQLAQPLWTAPQPNGWSDTAAEWATPEALMRRVDWVFTIAGRIGRRDPGEVAEAALGPLARAETVAEMRRAGSARDALTLLLASPEFLHR
ncbi:DUF1800 domain-containing protein [Falsiroseomonas sp. E2-1-a20]|uniref:DUF1800 domain-containing protein n=1 Tax=Falsiroseomonas sp. E2-1-a20 TaxID=3239300 RepID=UPI003F38B776